MTKNDNLLSNTNDLANITKTLEFLTVVDDVANDMSNNHHKTTVDDDATDRVLPPKTLVLPHYPAMVPPVLDANILAPRCACLHMPSSRPPSVDIPSSFSTLTITMQPLWLLQLPFRTLAPVYMALRTALPAVVVMVMMMMMIMMMVQIIPVIHWIGLLVGIHSTMVIFPPLMVSIPSSAITRVILPPWNQIGIRLLSTLIMTQLIQ